jgi:hypothetical protein
MDGGRAMKFIKSRYNATDSNSGLYIVWSRQVFVTDHDGGYDDDDDNVCPISCCYGKREIFGYEPTKTNRRRWKRVFRRGYNTWSGGGE